jgi:methionyl-tRNA formyltransferase
MKLVFCGTPEFAVPTLEKLAGNFDVKLVVTQPDRPSGRGMEVIAPPVKRLAIQLGFPVTQPDKIKNNAEFRAQLEAMRPDAIVVVAYGRIIPQWMIDLPPLGNINAHASLLPKYRGAAPIQWAIANGETVTGVTTMRIDAGLDTGPMLLRRETQIGSDETSVALAGRLAAIGAELMVETLRGLEARTLKPQPQDDSKASLARILKKEDGLIDFSRSAREIYNRFRGFQPWPGAYTQFRGKNLKVVGMKPAAGEASLAPGEIRFSGDRLLAGGGDGAAIELVELQPESRKAILAAQFARGMRLQPGERFGQRI